MVGQKAFGVFVHGYSCTRQHWAAVRDTLSAEVDAEVVSLPGHDGTPLPDGPLDIAACARHIDRVVEASGRTDAWIIGHSLGGMAGMVSVTQRPELYRGLVLVDAFPKMGPPHPFGLSFWAGSPPDLKRGLVRAMMATRRGFPSTLWESIVRFDGAPLLAQSTCPVRGIYGDRGEADHPALRDAVLSTGLYQAPDIEVYIVDQAGHFVMLEQPDAVCERLRHTLLESPGR